MTLDKDQSTDSMKPSNKIKAAIQRQYNPFAIEGDQDAFVKQILEIDVNGQKLYEEYQR